MAFTLSSAQTIDGIANSYVVTGNGNLTDFATAVSSIFTTTWNGNQLTVSSGGTNRIICISGTLIEQRTGSYSVHVTGNAHINWGSAVGNSTTTLSANASSGATSINVASATNIVVGSYLKFAGITTGGERNTKFYYVSAVAGNQITLSTGLSSALTSGAVVTIAGSSTLGNSDKTSIVNIMYGSTALSGYGDLNYPNLSIVGDGVSKFLFGAMTYSHNARMDMDFWKTAYVYIDNFCFNSNQTAKSWQKFFYGTTVFTTVNFSFNKNTASVGGSVLQAGGTTPQLTIPPYSSKSVGIDFTYLTNWSGIVQKPGYAGIGAYGTTGTGYIRIEDSAYLYCAPTSPSLDPQIPAFEFFRTFNITWKTPAGGSVGSVGVPAKLVAIGGNTPASGGTQNITTTPLVSSFNSESKSIFLRQSQKPANTVYTFNGVQTATGFTDDATYNLYLVSYGYATSFLAVSAKPTVNTVSTSGFALSTATAQNTIAESVPYASVITAPFTFSTTGNGTLTISSNCSAEQVGQYLLKLAYDNADQTFWMALNHNPANLVNGYIDIGSINIIGIEFLSGKIQSSGTLTANGTISNLSIAGDVSQATPTNLSNVTISGTLTYNTNTATSITLTNTTIGTVENSGTGIVTIPRDNTSNITTYTDAEINFLDSNLSAVGITSATIYGSQSDRDSGINARATFTTSIDFKYGSIVSGVTMQDTVYLRVVVGSVTLFSQITLVLGSNTLDLGVQGQLSSINAKVDLTAKEATILQTETDIIAEINANEVKIDAIKTKIDTLNNTDLTDIETSLEIINQGVKKTSLLIPHSTNL